MGTMFKASAEPGKVSGPGSYTIQKHLFSSIYGVKTQEISNLGGPPKSDRLVSTMVNMRLDYFIANPHNGLRLKSKLGYVYLVYSYNISKIWTYLWRFDYPLY